MAGPFDDLTPAQRQQIRDAHASAKERAHATHGPCGYEKAAGTHGPCEGPPEYRVFYRSPTTRSVLDTEQPFCFRHALVHVDRAHAAGSIAVAEFELIPTVNATTNTR